MSQASPYALALQRLLFFHAREARRLVDVLGSAEAVCEARHSLREALPDIGDALVRHLDTSWDDALGRAGQELEWCAAHGVTATAYGTPGYPTRLNAVPDAPAVLYRKGADALEATRSIAIVGTRRSTDYSRDTLRTFLADLREALPGTLIVSGLAYGVDITAHRAALDSGLPTVACLAHGLDTVYPSLHRREAEAMQTDGCLVTEYQTATRVDRQNFLSRNRIIAGLADCCIVAESMAYGGSLVTARLAADCGREVFAIPGRVTDEASEGCNRLIFQHAARPLLSASDLIKAMGWTTEHEAETLRRGGIQTSLFHHFTPTQQSLVDALRPADQSRDALCTLCQLPVNVVSTELFALEMDGVVRAKAGGVYHLIS